ncbi:MAG: murein biosynthesis integral membrane protein MurJ [Treponema sp.]|nr:murein biosynthesis integral membrane protein MurJ [Treponema sp.]
MEKEEEKSKKSSLLRSGLILSLMTLASRIMGLIREVTKGKFLGTGMLADAFTTAFMVPNLLRRLFAENAISVAFIPTFKGYLAKGDDPENKKETQEFIKATLTLVTFLTACVVIIGILIAPLITLIFCKAPVDSSAANYAEEFIAYTLKKTEITLLTRVMFPYLCLISIAAFFQGVLNGCKIFAPSGFTPVLFNGIIIAATYALSPLTSDPALAMSIGVVIGGVVQAVFQWPFLKQTGFKAGFTTLKKTFSNPGTRKVIALIVPTIIGMATYQLNDLVSTGLANRAGEGIAASLQYSLRLQELILGIFAVSIGTVILPDMAGLAAQEKWEDFNAMLIQSIKIMTMISIPVTAYSLIYGQDLISLIFKTGKFSDESVLITLGKFRWHMAGLLFIALNRVISPAFYAQKNTKLPTLAGIISFISNIILALILVMTPMKGDGIALALSLASLVNTVFLFIFMKKMNSFDVKKVVKNSLLYGLKLIILSVIAGVPCWFLRPVLINAFAGHGRLISSGLPVAISAIIFAIIGVAELIITKDEVVMVIIRKFKR